MHVDIDCSLEESRLAAVAILERGVLCIVEDHLRELLISIVVKVQFIRISRRRANVVDIDLVRL